MTKIYTPEQAKAEIEKQEHIEADRNRNLTERRRDAEERAAIKADLIAMGLWIGDAA
tara:strand:- start:2302 stop:2472 length:171 start_codon:yes stop_codon:yes gene_type:complete